MKQNKAFFAVVVSTFLLVGGILTGCSEQTKDAASNTVEGAAKDTANNTAAAGEAVGGAVANTGEAVGGAVVGAGEAAMGTGEKVADATGKAVENTGEAVAGAGKMAGEAVGGAAKEVQDGAQVLTITPKVKSALIASKIDASTVNVDTSGEKDTVILKGTVKSASEKTLAAQVAMKAIRDAGETFKVKNELAVAK